MKIQDLHATAAPSPAKLAEGFLSRETQVLAELSEIHELVARVERMLDRKDAEIARLKQELAEIEALEALVKVKTQEAKK